MLALALVGLLPKRFNVGFAAVLVLKNDIKFDTSLRNSRSVTQRLERSGVRTGTISSFKFVTGFARRVARSTVVSVILDKLPRVRFELVKSILADIDMESRPLQNDSESIQQSLRREWKQVKPRNQR